MFRNYFKIAWRSLIRSKGYSAINIGGLAVGMAVAILIGLWVFDELSFDKYHKNYERIAQVKQHANFNGKIETQVANPALMGPEIRAKYGSDFKYVIQSSWTGNHLLTIGDKHYAREGIFFDADAPGNAYSEYAEGNKSGPERSLFHPAFIIGSRNNFR